jgi:hypothetical protein
MQMTQMNFAGTFGVGSGLMGWLTKEDSPMKAGIRFAIVAVIVLALGSAGFGQEKPARSTPPASPATQGEVLPGSGTTTDELFRKLARSNGAFVIVAEAQNEAFQVVGYNLLGPGLMMRQTFVIRSVLRGDLKADQTIKVDYAVMHGEGGHERAIRKGERVMWIGATSTDWLGMGLKAIPDTPENRKALAAAIPAPVASPATQGEQRSRPGGNRAGLADPPITRISRTCLFVAVPKRQSRCDVNAMLCYR